MNHSGLLRFLPLVVLMTAPTYGVCADEEPPELAQVRAIYEKDVEFATRPIRDRYVSKLETLKRALATRGEVRGAVVVQDEIDRIRAASGESGIAKFAGVWILRYDSGAQRRYTITSGGSVTYDQENGTPISPRTAKITNRGADFLVEIAEGVIERLSISGKTLTLEHFNPKTLYPNSPPALRATGTLTRPHN